MTYKILLDSEKSLIAINIQYYLFYSAFFEFQKNNMIEKSYKSKKKLYYMPKTESAQKLNTGDLAPQFSLKGIDEKKYTLNDFKSKALLIVFMCNHCPYVKARIKDIIEIQSKFNEKELCIVGINSNDPNYPDEGFENMKEFSKQYNMNFHYLIDEKQNIAKDYGAVCTPDPFLFNKDRKLVFHGKINDATNPEMSPKINIMEKNVKRILNDEIIEKDFDPSIGCSIKWIE